jgi:hypothetical protein
MSCSYEGNWYKPVIANRLPAGALLALKGFWLPARILSFIGNSFLMFADDGDNLTTGTVIII